MRRALYMAALVGMRKNDVVRAHYQHLRAAGKPPKVALVACMRKLLLIPQCHGPNRATMAAQSDSHLTR